MLSGVREVPITCPRHLLQVEVQVGEQTLQASCSEAAGYRRGVPAPKPTHRHCQRVPYSETPNCTLTFKRTLSS